MLLQRQGKIPQFWCAPCVGLSPWSVRPPTQDAASPSLLPLGTTVSRTSQGEALDDAGQLWPLLAITAWRGHGGRWPCLGHGWPQGSHHQHPSPCLSCLSEPPEPPQNIKEIWRQTSEASAGTTGMAETCAPTLSSPHPSTWGRFSTRVCKSGRGEGQHCCSHTRRQLHATAWGV